MVWLKQFFRWWKQHVLHLHYLHNYWFCYGDKWKKNYPQVLRECKYKMKKTKMPKFIGTELESESELESNAELEAKLKFDFDSE